MKRYLITSSNEKSWKFDRPVVFLGEFCTSYKKKYIWSAMDAVIAEPYGLSVEIRKSDYQIVGRLKENLFELVCPILNDLHKVDYDNRFWLILLGDWLTRYVDVIYNRFKTLEQCIDRYDVSGASVVFDRECKLATSTSYSSIEVFNDDAWNHFIFSYILKKNYPQLHLDEIEGNGNNDFSVLPPENEHLTRKFVRNIFSTLNKVLFKIFGSKEDAFIISTYFPRFFDLKFQLSLGQFPIRWSLGHQQKGIALKSQVDSRLRDFIDNAIVRNESDTAIQSLLKNLFAQSLPVAYLEGFNEVSDYVSRLPWPTSPKFIFTSNNYDFDDIFKLYAARKVLECDSKYYVGCHGSGFFSYFENPTNVEKVCDKFITWGWHHGNPKHTPGFIFKTVGKKINYDRSGKIILIEQTLFNRVVTWDVYGDQANYFDKQVQFVNLLDENPRSNLIIRLHSSHKNRGWFESEKWHEVDKNLTIDYGVANLDKLIAKSRLLVFGYDSTGFAEAMSLNIPTLVYLQVGYDQLNDFSKPYYSALLDAEIAHVSPESLARKVNEIWKSIDNWWMTSEVQNARLQYCDKYARTSNSPLAELKNLLAS